MNARIFVSYTFRDGSIDADKLRLAKAHLSTLGHVFVDHLSDTTACHPQLKIIWHLIRCHLVVIIESRMVYRSPWVLLELLIAKVTLTPIVEVPASLLEPGHCRDADQQERIA